MQVNKRLLTTIFSLILCLSFFSSAVRAIIISPAIIDLNLDRGQEFEGNFSVFFTADDPAKFYLYVKKLEFEDPSNNQITIDQEEEDPTLANWITLEKDFVDKPAVMGVVNEDSIVKVNYKVKIPEDAPPGAHFAQIIVSQSDIDPTTGGSRVQLGAEVGYQILVNLKGDRDYNTDLVDFKIKNNQFIFPHIPAIFETSFKNNGNVYVIPNANIEIMQFGNKIETITMNPKQSRVFPGNSRTFENIWSEENIEEISDPLVQKAELDKIPTSFFDEVMYEIRNFRIGFYTAEIQGFAGAQAPYKASVNFFVLPYHLLSIILGVLILVFVVGKLSSRKPSKRSK
jgi:hypothetical protein